MLRTPSYFVWGCRKHAISSSPRSPRRTADDANMNNSPQPDGGEGMEDGPSPLKMRTPRSRTTTVAGADNQSTDTKSSGLSGDSGGLNSSLSVSPKHKDPDRIKKDREREERVRVARERLEEERKKKLVELQEQQKQAQENREKQLEMRRQKIEDLRRRDFERRAEVEKRRREKEGAERNRRESLLLKAEERVARYEAWKRGGQKGTPPGGASMPTTKHLSVSTSVLYHKRKSDLTASSSGELSASNRPDSQLERSRPRTSSSARRVEEKDRDRDESRKADKSARMSRSTLDRLSAPKQSTKTAPDGKEAPPFTPRQESPAARNLSVREKMSKDAAHKAHPLPKAAVAAASSSASTALGTGISPAVTPNKSRDHSPATPASRTPSRTPVRVFSPPPAGADEDGGSEASTMSRSMITTSAAESTFTVVTSATGMTTSTTVNSATSMMTSTTEKSSNMDKSITEKSSIMDKSFTMDKSSVMDKSTGDITAVEYKAKLAEKRRQAREKAEKEAEEERRRQEEADRLEEERLLQEEEEERRQLEEAMKQAEEAREAEEERLQKAIEAEDARRAEEAVRVGQEKLAKEEAERKAKEEAERMEIEKQEKARREEEERLERKKRLEMIMKRVKTDNTGDSSKEVSKSLTSSPTKSVASTASSDVSPVESDNKTILGMTKAEESTEGVTVAGEEKQAHENGSISPVTAPSPVPVPFHEAEKDVEETVEVKDVEPSPTLTTVTESPVGSGGVKTHSSMSDNNGSGDKLKFKSPLLQKLVEGKEDAGSTPSGPRFKSPLLQNILGKTKVGARMGFLQDYSVSTPDLSRFEAPSSHEGNGTRVSPLRDTGVMSSSMFDMGSPGDDVHDSNHKESMNRNEEKDLDTSEGSSSPSSHHSSPSHTEKTPVSNGEDMGSSIAAFSASHVGDATPMDISGNMELSISASRMAWSEHNVGADGTSALPASLQFSYNGHGPTASAHGGLEDSSISMRSVESSVTSSVTDSAAGSVFSSITSLPHGQGQSDNQDFEELIDLSIRNKAASAAVTTFTFLDNSDDHVNFNTVEESEEMSDVPPPPIIAFEESGTVRCQDVSDLLS